MKKTFIIALCCMALSFAACKPDNPTPNDPVDDVDYTEKYVGNYIGDFDLTIATINNEAVTPTPTFPVPSIGMVITKGDADNVITATVTIDDVTRQTTGKASANKADFDAVNLLIDKPDQGYTVELKLKMEGTISEDGALVIEGNFTDGHGVIVYGQANPFDEASGTISGKLVKQ